MPHPMPTAPTPERRKQAAVGFLRMAVAGKAQQSIGTAVARDAKHHNPHFPAGMAALTQAMDDNAKANPGLCLEVKHVLADGDMVAVHSHVVHKPGEAGIAVVHLFRFEADTIVEFWDVAQEIPQESPNAEGMF